MQPPADPAPTSLGRRIPAPNGAVVSFPVDEVAGSIVRRFEKIAFAEPGRIAVKFDNQTLTYDALNRLANRIARAIIERRGKDSEPVALLFGPGVDSIAALLGVQKAGKFFFAIDPQFPAERARFLSLDTQAPLMVTDGRHFELARSIKLENQTVLNLGNNPHRQGV